MNDLNRIYAWKAALLCKAISAPLSSFYMSRALAHNAGLELKEYVQRSICKFCGSIFDSDNHVMRLSTTTRTERRRKTCSLRESKSRRKRILNMILKCKSCNKIMKINVPRPKNHDTRPLRNFQRCKAPNTVNRTSGRALNNHKWNSTNTSKSSKRKNAKPSLLGTTPKMQTSKKNTIRSQKSNKSVSTNKKDDANLSRLNMIMQTSKSKKRTKSRLEAFLSSVNAQGQ